MALDEQIDTPVEDDGRGGVSAGGPDGASEALLLIKHVSEHPEISVVGDLDAASVARLREAAEMAIEGAPSSLTIDGRAIDRVGVAGLTALADTVSMCRERGIRLDLILSASARAMLDSVGLWWLGAIDRGPALEAAIRDAHLAFGQQHDLDLPRRSPAPIDLQ